MTTSVRNSTWRRVRYALTPIIALAMVLSGFPQDFLLRVHEGRIIDELYMSMNKSGRVIDNFYFGYYAEAAETFIDNNLFDATDEFSPSPNTVFINDQIGYSFFVDTGVNNVSFRKTSDGGASWTNLAGSSADEDMDGTMGTNLNWSAVSVWYDQWTPGDTSGELIHVIAINASNDDMYYSYVDTNGGSGETMLQTNVAVTGTTGTTFTPAGDGTPSITKATDGDLFASVCGTFSSVVQCVVHTSTNGGTSWGSDIGHSSFNDDDDSMQLFPLSGGDILAVYNDITANLILSRVYDQSTGWDGSAALSRTLVENATYDESFGAALDKTSGDIYVAFSNALALDSTTNDVEVWKYTESSRTWGQKTNAASNNEFYQPSVALDGNTGDVYVVYARGNSTADAADDTDIFYVRSTDDGSSWDSPAQLNSTANLDRWYVRTNMWSDSRLYAVFYDNGGNDLDGNTVADLWAWEQEAYRFFANANGTDVGSALAAQDSIATLSTSGEAFRLRLLLHNIGQAPISGENLKLQFAQMSGSCDTAFSGESYADVTGATVIAYNNNASPSDGDNLTANASDPTVGHTVVNQDYEETNNFTNSVALIPAGQDGKWDFSLIDNGATANTSYCFRVVRSDDALLNSLGGTYDVVPQITTADSSPVYSVSVTSSGVIEYGFVELGNSTTTLNGYTQMAENDGNTTAKLSVKSSNATGGTSWTLASSVGSNVFTHEFSTTTGSSWATLPDSDTYVLAAPSVAMSGVVDFDFRLMTPSSSADYQQKSITITVLAEAP